MEYMNQAKFMREFSDEYREDFNPRLFERNDEDTIEAIHQVLLSCEKDRYFTLKLLDFRPIYDYEEIYNTLREHEERRKKKNSKLENIYDYINIKDTDMILLQVHWLVRHNGIEKKEDPTGTIDVKNPESVVEVLIAIPRFVNKYYFKISGNYYSTIYQIVDGSTYNNTTANNSKSDVVTFKSMFMSNKIFRQYKSLTDINTKSSINTVEYCSAIFNTPVNAMYYIFANYGLYGAADFFKIDCVNLSEEPVTANDYFCFKKHNLYISVPKYCFNQDPMVQSFVATLYNGINKDATLDNIFDTRYWLHNLGSAFKNSNIDKGLFVLDSIDGIYDNITKRDLHLPETQKKDIYTILRWLLQEFDKLKAKENIDVRTKRLRIAEYIAHVYAMRLNRGLHRVTDIGKKVTLKKVIQAIYTQPMYLINQLSGVKMSNLIDYKSIVNDNDAPLALKYTYKGISGLGEDGAAIQKIYRYVDPSHVGILDLDASTNSDPGMSGMLVPMCKVYEDNSFSNYQEPLSWMKTERPIQDQWKKDNGYNNPISIPHYQDKYYYHLRDKIIDEQLEFDKPTCPLYNLNDNSISYNNDYSTEIKANKEPKSLFELIKEEKEKLSNN